MAITEAQRRAKEKYAKNYRVFIIRVNKKLDSEMAEHLEAQESIQGYILDLVRKDMENKKLWKFIL